MDMPPLGNVCAWCEYYVVVKAACECPCAAERRARMVFEYHPRQLCDCRHFKLVSDIALRAADMRGASEATEERFAAARWRL